MKRDDDDDLSHPVSANKAPTIERERGSKLLCVCMQQGGKRKEKLKNRKSGRWKSRSKESMGQKRTWKSRKRERKEEKSPFSFFSSRPLTDISFQSLSGSLEVPFQNILQRMISYTSFAVVRKYSQYRTVVQVGRGTFTLSQLVSQPRSPSMS